MCTKDSDSVGTDERVTDWANWWIKRWWIRQVLLYIKPTPPLVM